MNIKKTIKSFVPMIDFGQTLGQALASRGIAKQVISQSQRESNVLSSLAMKIKKAPKGSETQKRLTQTFHKISATRTDPLTQMQKITPSIKKSTKQIAFEGVKTAAFTVGALTFAGGSGLDVPHAQEMMKATKLFRAKYPSFFK